jgi:hypothetical protein
MNATPAATAPSTIFDPSAPVAEEYDVFCDGCGYSLLGLAADRCPECGRPFSAGDLPYARVAWLHRRRIGRWTAYWRTVRHVVLQPASFAAEMCRPVRISAEDAKRFRRLAIHLAAAAGLLTALAVPWLTGDLLRWWRQGSDHLPVYLLTALGGWLAAVVFLRLATDMPLFIWNGMPSLPPSELAPLHQYAAAPLALMPAVLAVAVLFPVVVSSARLPAEWVLLARVTAVAAVVTWVVICWKTPLALMKAATGCSTRRVSLLGFYLPLHCLLMASLVGMTAAALALGVTYVLDEIL